MPLTFSDIKFQKDRRIFWLFSFYVAFYVLSIYLLYFVSRAFIYSSLQSEDGSALFYFWPSAREMAYVFIAAFVVAFLSWAYTAANSTNAINTRFAVRELDPNDKYHKRLLNIIDEIKIASGLHNVRGVVLPALAINGLSFYEFGRGTYCIGVTEGALAHLNRQQLEALVAHEMGHIVSGDIKTATMFAALAGFYSKLSEFLDRQFVSNNTYVFSRSSYMRNSRARERAQMFAAYILALRLLAGLLKGVSRLLAMAISHEREYRADAVAVQLTRDPLSVAEALCIIKKARHRSMLLCDEFIATLFIVSPSDADVKTVTGFWDRLFTTHPPLEKRVDILLGQAHIDRQTLDRQVESHLKARKSARVLNSIQLEGQGESEGWFAFNGSEWQGPFSPKELIELSWVLPDTFVKNADGSQLKTFTEFRNTAQMLSEADGKGGAKSLHCPVCGPSAPLVKGKYEGAEIWYCANCGGLLVPTDSVRKILFRQEQGFSPEVVDLGEKIIADIKARPNILDKPAFVLKCPKCGLNMQRKLFSDKLRIEIDVCYYCNLYFFDSMELETAQYVFEKIESPLPTL